MGVRTAGGPTANDDVSGVPVYLWFLTLLTILYLLVEVPFAAFLVNLLGSDAGHDDIERAEQCGRIISGAALALAVWGWQIPRYRSIRKPLLNVVFLLAISASACISGVYYGEKALIDQIAANAPVHSRQQALAAVAVRNELFSAGVTGIDAGAPGISEGPWRAFVGLFPFISMQDKDVLDRTVSGKQAVVAAAVDRVVPSSGDFRTLVYDNVLEVWKQRFVAYREATFARTRALGPVRDRVERGWNDHVRNMEYRGVIGKRRVSREAVVRVVSDVQNAGVPVPDNWNPTDQETFQRAAFGEIMPEVDGPYNDAVAAIVGDGAMIRPTIETFDEFLREADVQAGIRRDLGLVSYDGMVVQGMDGAGFDALYRSYAAGFSRELSEAYLGDPGELRRGGKFDEIAQAAVRSVWVPVLALSLSLLGAAGHVIKLANYLVTIVARNRKSSFGISRMLGKNLPLRMGVIGSLASVAVMFGYVPANAIVESPYYAEASKGIEERYGPQVEQGIVWTISWQNTLVPAGSIARSVGVFLPLENYLVGDGIDVDVRTSPVTLADVPLPRPRPSKPMPDISVASTVDVPMPIPRPHDL